MKVVIFFMAFFTGTLCNIGPSKGGRPTAIQPNRCTSFVMHDCVEKEKSKLTGTICVNDTEEYLTKLLKDVGGYNPRYVATNIYQTANFEDPSQFVYESRTSGARIKLPKLIRLPCDKNVYRPGHPCYNVKSPVRPTVRPTRPWPRRGKRLIRAKRSAGVKVEGCYGKGSLVGRKGHFRMCSTCHLITTLSANHFPRFLNEAACRHSLDANLGQTRENSRCIADAGTCEQRSIKLAGLVLQDYTIDKVMSEKIGKVAYKQKWNEVTLNIKSCCDCQLNKGTKGLLETFQGFG